MGNVSFTPVEVGDLGSIPPDAPPGSWTAQCAVKKSKTSKDGFPMLILEWRLLEANEEENESHKGAKVTDFVTFFPSTHPATRMARMRLKGLCDALSIDLPATERISTWDDVADFINALEGVKGTIYTTVAPRKDTGEMATSVRYSSPGGLTARPVTTDDDEDDEGEGPPAKSEPPSRKVGPTGKPLKKRAKAA